MQPVDKLINKSESAWPLVQQWIESARNNVEVSGVLKYNELADLFDECSKVQSAEYSICYPSKELVQSYPGNG